MEKFNEINYAPLRIYNRCVMMFNLSADKGFEVGKKYMSEFSPKEKTEMLDMLNTVKKYGNDRVKKDIMRNMPLQDGGELVAQ